ncbi:hypothetical protein B0O99DRAFT_707597 [Bisporella sp. PMI_857]|nr:hypothetical protein B0O99DRAFT_707597 [Bisporella sp. PMI_857]
MQRFLQDLDPKLLIHIKDFHYITAGKFDGGLSAASSQNNRPFAACKQIINQVN